MTHSEAYNDKLEIIDWTYDDDEEVEWEDEMTLGEYLAAQPVRFATY